MAEFKIHELQGMRYVDVHLNHEVVRLEPGALSYVKGEIAMHSHLVPSIRDVVTSFLSGESAYRLTCTGTGIITLESSLGGFHAFRLNGESWILEQGTFWAAEGAIDVKFHHERTLTAFWAGEGLVYLQTKISGYGQALITTRGPIEEITLEKGQEFVAEGKAVVGRTADVTFRMRRLTKNRLGRFTSGEGLIRAYRGPGRVLLNPAPYWSYYLLAQRNLGFNLPTRTDT